MAATPLEDLTHVIQLSVAPVFLLTAVGTILSVLSSRLGRIVDRSRVLRDRLEALSDDKKASALEELATLGRRRRLVNRAITFGTITALLVCLVIVVAFLAYLIHVLIGWLVASLFILAMIGFILALVSFLHEVMLASATHTEAH